MNAPAATHVEVAEVAGAFGHLLHAAGVPVAPERSARFARAIRLAHPATLAELYWAGRVTLVSGHEQVEVYDRVFAQVFGGLVDLADHRGDTNAPPPVHARPGSDRRPGQGDRTSAATRPSAVGADSPAGGDQRDDREEPSLLAAASRDERLRSQDFARCSPEELRALAQLIAALPLVPPTRPARRTARHPTGERLDLRATVRRARRTAGDPLGLVRRRRRVRPRRLVLIADVSGSMAPYARAYLHLLHGAVRATRAEAFVFATRLTRLTRALATSDADLALRRAGLAAPDWSGGTRIGEALKQFNDEHGRRGLARGAIVVIVSDGWERDDPALVGEQMARLARLAHRIVWVNPRRASAAYQPLVGGMAAALPHVDAFVSGHSVAALDEVLDAIRG